MIVYGSAGIGDRRRGQACDEQKANTTSELAVDASTLIPTKFYRSILCMQQNLLWEDGSSLSRNRAGHPALVESTTRCG